LKNRSINFLFVTGFKFQGFWTGFWSTNHTRCYLPRDSMVPCLILVVCKVEITQVQWRWSSWYQINKEPDIDVYFLIILAYHRIDVIIIVFVLPNVLSWIGWTS